MKRSALRDVLESLDSARREALLARNPHIEPPPPIVDGDVVDARVAVDDSVTATFEGMRLVSEANAREHWQIRARRVKRQRRAVQAALEGVEPPDGHTHLVTITRRGPRLLDTDNLYGGAKFYCDFLRYCGAIPEDTEDQIELKVTQRKVRKGEEEKTIIEVWKRKE